MVAYGLLSFKSAAWQRLISVLYDSVATAAIYNEEVDLRDAVQAFNELSQEEREQVALSEADYKKLARGARATIRNDVSNWPDSNALG